MAKWDLKIERSNNGYILEGKFGDTDTKTKLTITEKEPCDCGELVAMRDLLWEVMEYFGVYNSKHKEYNLKLQILDQDGDELDERLL